MLAGLVTCRSCYLTRTITTLHETWGKSISLTVALSFFTLAAGVRSTTPETQWFPWLISLFCSPDSGHKVHSHTGATRGATCGASSWLFLQISKVRAGKGGDFLWIQICLFLTPTVSLCPERTECEDAIRTEEKPLQGWSAQISSRTSSNDKRHLERPFSSSFRRF